jgi:hypothetical protein
VGQGSDLANSGVVEIGASALASGIYFVDFEGRDGGGSMKNRILRLAVVK